MGRFFAFIVTFAVLFAITVGFLAFVNSLPNGPSTEQAPDNSVQTSVDVQASDFAPSGAGELPTRIVAKAIGLDVAVVNPTSTVVDDLDNALEQGAVRYPTSGLLGVNGTVLIFGHSSYLPIVYHQYYKTFDGIQNLKQGDIVSVYSADKEYRYSVTGVTLKNADDDIIELPTDNQYLTLDTCDSFATKSDRFVVTATLQGVYPVTSTSSS